MKQLQKSDLKEGEIYTSKSEFNPNNLFIWECSNNNQLIYNFRLYVSNINAQNGNLSLTELSHSWDNIFEATPEEKHWLETCIKENKFISYEEAMKSFIPEYVELLPGWSSDGEFVGEIFDTKKDFQEQFKKFKFVSKHTNWKEVLRLNWIPKFFKPSTKEAYDAQFVAKEPEFVLPKLWCIQLTIENQETVIDYINQNTKDGKRRGLIDVYYGYNSEHCTCIFNTLSNTEITFDQFKQYVLKENTTVTEEPKIVFEEPKDKVIQTTSSGGKIRIDKVECSEGGVYKIGDKIKVFDRYSPNKGKIFTIKSFRWSNDKSKICAVTELHTSNGIGLDKIELYVEPKVKQELSLLEQAKLKYPIGIKFKSATSGKIFTIKNHNVEKTSNPNIIIFQTNELNQNGNSYACVYYKNQWAEIVDDFVLPEKWCVEVNPENENFINSVRDRSCSVTFITSNLILPDVKNSWYCHPDAKKRGFTEITFEQFKKYVLKDE